MPLNCSVAARACANELLRWGWNSISVITAFRRTPYGLRLEFPRPTVASSLTSEGMRYLMENCVDYVIPGVQLS